jgi:glutamate-1-semialdehyde 2,1-aminomutase
LILPAPGYLETMRELCTVHGTLLIFDEVMTGFRLARGGAQELLGVRPDLSCFGKVIGGGLPVGALGGRADIMDFLAPLGPVYQAGTLSGNPLAMAAGLAQLKVLEEQDIFAKLEKLGAQLEAETCAALKSAGLDYVFYRIGSMFCLFFTGHAVKNLETAKASDLDQFARFFHALLTRGIYIAPSQFETGFLSAAHTEDDIAQTAQAIRKALRAI